MCQGPVRIAKLREELDWIDANISDKPYGIDIVLPINMPGLPDIGDVDEMTQTLMAQIPADYLEFAEKFPKGSRRSGMGSE